MFSFEVKPAHMDIARQNFTRWARSWNLGHTQTHGQWPDNVSFHCASLEDARHYLEEPVDGVSWVGRGREGEERSGGGKMEVKGSCSGKEIIRKQL